MGNNNSAVFSIWLNISMQLCAKKNYINGWYIQPYTCTWGRWNSKKKICGKRLSFCVEERCRHICLVNIQVSYGSSIIGTHLWIWEKKHASSGCQDLLNCGGHGWYGFTTDFRHDSDEGFRSQNQNGCIRLHSSNWWFFHLEGLKLGCWYWKIIPILYPFQSQIFQINS